MDREHIYRGRDGCSLFARVIDATGKADSASIVLFHGGGPDHQSLLPLAGQLSDLARVITPDIRGYGRSICKIPDLHRWSQYAHDVASLLDHLEIDTAIVGGAGLGGTIALRAAIEHPGRIAALVVMSMEDIEDDAAKAAEIKFMEDFACRVRKSGLEAAWQPILKNLAPVIGSMVREAIPRSSPDSIAAAAAIGRDRAFRSVAELAQIDVPALIFPGIDWRHPARVAKEAVATMPQGRMAAIGMSGQLTNSQDYAAAFAPEIRAFLKGLP
ncbi:alpha/beta fold hydrolase [Novosphingobium aquimarinum]|uniref:alpha/beta fold hydrolase n=1 Tax=Novosphingobium aquimarinum TaxID=2682494 RepID=UPI0012EB2EC2|nr:alpha/beta hydrolase [Novosphingobium aquimarinum]